MCLEPVVQKLIRSNGILAQLEFSLFFFSQCFGTIFLSHPNVTPLHFSFEAKKPNPVIMVWWLKEKIT